MPSAPIIIIGAGLAGYTLALEIRKRDPDTPVTLVSRGRAGFAEDLGIQALPGTAVTDIDPAGGFVWLSDGRPLVYRHLALALGADFAPQALGDGNTTGQATSIAGLLPRVELAALAGLARGRGIQVDRHLETSRPAIYALGACAEVAGHLTASIEAISQQALALARTLTGTPTEVGDPALFPVETMPASPPLLPSRPRHY